MTEPVFFVPEKIKYLSPLELQEIDENICPACHAEALRDRSTASFKIAQCSACYAIYILNEK